ncbi:MAG TPA: hypothetical protein VHA09_05555 [Nitrososphaera sp.]|nr:hypothetical protein [Nitrososphaera sp.]
MATAGKNIEARITIAMMANDDPDLGDGSGAQNRDGVIVPLEGLLLKAFQNIVTL